MAEVKGVLDKEPVVRNSQVHQDFESLENEMSAPIGRNSLIASLAAEREHHAAVAAVRKRGWPIVEVSTPYAVHGLARALGLPRCWLSASCFLCGLFGLAAALGFQFWSTAWSWPLNVGGQPWNSLPAFVPVM